MLCLEQCFVFMGHFFSARVFKAIPTICLVFLSYEPSVFLLTPAHLHGCHRDGLWSSSAEEDGSTELSGAVPGERHHHAGACWDSGLRPAPLETSLEKGLSCFLSPKIAF